MLFQTIKKHLQHPHILHSNNFLLKDTVEILSTVFQLGSHFHFFSVFANTRYLNIVDPKRHLGHVCLAPSFFYTRIFVLTADRDLDCEMRDFLTNFQLFLALTG